MYNNPYISAYNPQASIDRINNQIAELEKLKSQIPSQPIQQPTNLTQNFQLAPTNREVIRYASSIDEVQRDMVIGDTPYFSKDMSVVWVKNTKGEITTYELNEIKPLDEKDIQIKYLQEQIEELKKGTIISEQHNTNVITTETRADTKELDEPTRTTTEKNSPTSVSRTTTSKKK
jgi:hypothetical protein